MKIAPLLRAFRPRKRIQTHLLHTGQHYDASMSAAFFTSLGIPPPQWNLGVGAGGHARQTAETMVRFEPVLEAAKPDLVLVVGDVNATVACALTAAKARVPVAHVEAGLRSGDRTMPEEVNRVVTDALSTWLFVTEPEGKRNLLREGVSTQRIFVVGNVMIDTLLDTLRRTDVDAVLRRFGVAAGEYALLTLHRPRNVDAPAQLRGLLAAAADLGRTAPVLFPVHPRTRQSIRRFRLSAFCRSLEGVRLLPPLDHPEFAALQSKAGYVLTDSGGIQEETTVLRVPCFTLRDNTERPITLRQGTNRLVGTDPKRIPRRVRAGLARPRRARRPRLWDGRAAERIAAILGRKLR